MKTHHAYSNSFDEWVATCDATYWLGAAVVIACSTTEISSV